MEMVCLIPKDDQGRKVELTSLIPFLEKLY